MARSTSRAVGRSGRGGWAGWLLGGRAAARAFLMAVDGCGGPDGRLSRRSRVWVSSLPLMGVRALRAPLRRRAGRVRPLLREVVVVRHAYVVHALHVCR